MHLINVKFSFQKTTFAKNLLFRSFYSSPFLFEAYISLFEILHFVNDESRDSQKFAFEKREYYHDSNIFSFKFFKLSSSQLHDVQCLFKLFEIYLYSNYPNLRLHLNYPAFEFHFNFRYSDFHLNYSITALDLMFKKSNVEYRVLEISVR